MKIGEEVSSRRYPDLVFTIVKIENGRAVLEGKDYRLVAEAEVENLLPPSKNKTAVSLPLITTNRSRELKVGTVLHLDGDEYYLNKALQVYKYYGIKAVGYHVEERRLGDLALDLAKKHEPDIVVLTGHDGLRYGCESRLYDEGSYRFSGDYASAVRRLRAWRSSLDDLVIIAGACQSYYELLIEAGSNFASSPSRDNIHLLDPVIIASQIALSPARDFLPIEELIANTVTKKLGGLDTRGKARKIYRGG